MNLHDSCKRRPALDLLLHYAPDGAAGIGELLNRASDRSYVNAQVSAASAAAMSSSWGSRKIHHSGKPNRIRTGVWSLRGSRPEPLDDGFRSTTFELKLAPSEGFEPPTAALTGLRSSGIRTRYQST